ncbi:MAG TPA: hypothetical protein VEV45_22860 [Streptosporangiaceae bacterium]|nr:hypothetical protein [Streptosporangiaceae bacterium]
MSSDGTGSVRKTVARKTAPRKASSGRAATRKTAAEPNTPTPARAADDGPGDPWFTPGPKAAYVDAGLAGTDGDSVQGEWFLRAGRAGLLPESMTETWDEAGAAAEDRTHRASAAGVPPWGPDGAAATAGQPPPWEVGPWPGPGEEATQRPWLPAAGPRGAEPAAEPSAGLWRSQRSRLIMIGGAAVVVLVVVIVVIVMATSAGPGTGCATYPSAVRQAYARAMSDLSGHAPRSVQAADLERAATVANASAAAAGQQTARTAMFAMASDLDEASADVARHRQLTSDLQQRLTADGTALPRSC